MLPQSVAGFVDWNDLAPYILPSCNNETVNTELSDDVQYSYKLD